MCVVGSWLRCLQAGFTARSASTGFSSSSWGNVVLVVSCVKKTFALTIDIFELLFKLEQLLALSRWVMFSPVSCDFVKMGFVLPCIL